MTLNYSDIDWKTLLVKRYLSYDLSELNVMTLFVSDAVLSMQPKTLLTCDILSSYMAAGKNEIDQSLTALISKNYLVIHTEGASVYTSIEEFKERLYQDFVKDLILKGKDDRGPLNGVSPSLYTDIEEINGGTLAPIERDYVARWLKDGADEPMIKEACRKNITKSGTISFKGADRQILEMERSQTRQDIGVSTVNEDTRKKEEYRDLFDTCDWTYHGDK